MNSTEYLRQIHNTPEEEALARIIRERVEEAMNRITRFPHEATMAAIAGAADKFGMGKEKALVAFAATDARLTAAIATAMFTLAATAEEFEKRGVVLDGSGSGQEVLN